MRIAIITAIMLACTAVGQTLSFDRPVEPQAGRATATLARATALEDEASTLADDNARSRAQAGLRRFTAALLRAGEMQGSPGSRAVNAGRAIDSVLGEIDVVIAGVADVDEHTGAMLRVAVIELGHATQRITARPDEAHMQIRPGLSAIMQIIGGDEACCDRVATVGAAWETVRDVPGVTDAAIEALAAFDASIARADAWLAYRCAAHHARQRVERAAVGVVKARAMLGEPAQVSLASRFDTAARGLVDGPVTPAFDDLALWGRAIELAEAGPGQRQTRDAMEQLLTRISPDVRHVEQLEAFIRAAELCAAQRGIGDERTVVRQLRPAWRAISRRARSLAGEVAVTLPSLLRDSHAMTDPALLAVLAALREQIEAIAMLERLSRVLASEHDGRREPLADEAWARTADRLLRLAQQVEDDRTRPSAMTALVAFERRATRIAAPDGERDLRDALAEAGDEAHAAAWARVTEDRTAELLDALDERRRAWRQRCEREGLDANADEALATARALSAASESVRALRAAEMKGFHSAWFIPSSVASSLAMAHVNMASLVVRDALDGEFARALEGAARLETSQASARLMAWITREDDATGQSLIASLLRLTCAGGDHSPAAGDIAIAARYAADADMGDAEHARLARAWGEAAAERALRAWPIARRDGEK